MKFPSVKYLATQATTTYIRFYLPLLFAFIGAAFLVMQIEHYDEAYNKYVFACSLGLSLSLGCFLFAERSGKRTWRIAAVVLPLLAAAAYCFWLAPDELWRDLTPTITYVVLVVVVHLFVAVAPYLQRNEPMGFWRYNETLFARMLLSAVFSATLFIGLAGAIGACDILFKLHVDYKIYPKLWIIVVSIFNTWFFLAGIPTDFATINTEKIFPKFLKIFTQYILIPIVTLYMLILYAYSIKIVAAWSLPHGWVSMLILCYSVAGILAVLLVTPLRDDKDTPWVRLFSRFFFIATLPLIVLLYVAILTRVNEYGITESRYYLLLMGAWLGGISLYFIFSSKKSIKVIPVSLAVMGLLSLVGPWSAFSVSERSQLYRLQGILIKNKVWAPGQKIATPPAKMPAKDAEQVRSIIRYTIDRDKAETLQPYITVNIDTIIAAAHFTHHGIVSNMEWEVKDNLKEKLVSLFCANASERTANDWDCTFETDSREGLDVAGYSKAFTISLGRSEGDKEVIVLSASNSVEVYISEKDSTTSLVFARNDTVIEDVPLNAVMKKLSTYPHDNWQYTVNRQQMVIDGIGPLKPRIILRSIRLNTPHRSHEFTNVNRVEASVLIP